MTDNSLSNYTPSYTFKETLLRPGIKLEGEVGEIVYLNDKTSPSFQIKEK